MAMLIIGGLILLTVVVTHTVGGWVRRKGERSRGSTGRKDAPRR